MKKQDTLYQLLFTALSLYLIFLMLRYPGPCVWLPRSGGAFEADAEAVCRTGCEDDEGCVWTGFYVN